MSPAADVEHDLDMRAHLETVGLMVQGASVPWKRLLLA